MTNVLPYDVSLSHAFDGDGAPPQALYDTAREEAQGALQKLVGADPPLELFSNVARSDDLTAATEVAAGLLHDTTDVFVFGIGGSSLGGQALAQLVPLGTVHRARVTFHDNPDPVTFEQALAACDLKTTRFVSISKSGGTAETLMQTLAAADALRKAGGEGYLRQHFAVITEPKPSPLRHFAETIGCPVLDHPLGIGGRYSVLSVVGMLPAVLMGLDAKAIRAGARDVLAQARAGTMGVASPAAGAALHAALARHGALHNTVLWAYADRLKTFGAWWRQLWAESLGKSGLGSTPVAALGPVDQHSQLQLFLDGPGGALYTLLAVETAGKGPEIAPAGAGGIGAAYLGGHHMGDLVDAEARATAETLARRGRPVRVIRCAQADAHTMGALFMHFMLETILMGRLMGVDPFDQPAVEEGKVLARTYLEQGSR